MRTDLISYDMPPRASNSQMVKTDIKTPEAFFGIPFVCSAQRHKAPHVFFKKRLGTKQGRIPGIGERINHAGLPESLPA